MLSVIHTAKAPQMGAFAQAVKVNNLVFLSNQTPLNTIDNSIPQSIQEQTSQVIDNVSTILRSAGTNLSHVAKATFYIDNIANIDTITEIAEQYFTIAPAVSFITVSSLPPHVKVQMEAIAILDDFLIGE